MCKDMCQDAKSCDMEAKFCLGVRMYLVYESLDHHPRIWIVASLMPRDAAVVAAPIRKEWPL